jgi:hypothetical protein
MDVNIWSSATGFPSNTAENEYTAYPRTASQ